jgi:septum formation protein
MYRNKMPLVLASASPRRRELLGLVGISFEIIPSQIEESELGGADPALTARSYARQKAEAVARQEGDRADRWYLGVDTIVILDRQVLGKPADRDQAREFLRQLSGRQHQVITAYCLLRPQGRELWEKAISSQVKIRGLAPAEIEAYLDTDEPYDKAGAYAAQGVGASLIVAIEGSYTNVVGLPLAELTLDLLRLGIIEPKPGHG